MRHLTVFAATLLVICCCLTRQAACGDCLGLTITNVQTYSAAPGSLVFEITYAGDMNNVTAQAFELNKTNSCSVSRNRDSPTSKVFTLNNFTCPCGDFLVRVRETAGSTILCESWCTFTYICTPPSYTATSCLAPGTLPSTPTAPTATNDALEVFYTGTNDVLYHNWQNPPGGAWVGQHLLGNATDKAKAPGPQLSQTLAVGQSLSGQLEVFYIGTNDVLYHNRQTSPGAWDGERLLSLASNEGKALAVGRNVSGALEVFYIGTNDVLYHNWQDPPGGAWVGEHLLGPATAWGKALAVGRNVNGALEVLYVGTDDVLYRNRQNAAGGGWVGQSLLDKQTTKAKALAVGRNVNRALEVFYTGTNDVLYHNWQNPPGGAWVGEQLLGTATTTGKALAVGRNASGALEVFYIGTDNVLYHVWQRAPGGNWVSQNLLDNATTTGKALAVSRNSTGTLEVFYIGTDDVLYHVWQRAPGGNWVSQNLLDNATTMGKVLAVGRNANGPLEVLYDGEPQTGSFQLVSTVTVSVPEGVPLTGGGSTNRVATGVTLQPNQYVQVTATGTINAGVFGAGDNGPDGWEDWEGGDKFPLRDAHPYCLIGRFGPVTGQFGSGPFFSVGSRLAHKRFSGTVAGNLFLGINDDAPGNGSGAFNCTVEVFNLLP